MTRPNNYDNNKSFVKHAADSGAAVGGVRLTLIVPPLFLCV